MQTNSKQPVPTAEANDSRTASDKAVVCKELLGGCAMCGTPTSDKLCLTCCRKVKPVGPPLKRLRRYGFRVTYRLRQVMNCARDITGSIPTEAEPETGSIKVSYLYVACDGNTYVGHEWISPGGSSYSWSEPYPPNSYSPPSKPV